MICQWTLYDVFTSQQQLSPSLTETPVEPDPPNTPPVTSFSNNQWNTLSSSSLNTLSSINLTSPLNLQTQGQEKSRSQWYAETIGALRLPSEQQNECGTVTVIHNTHEQIIKVIRISASGEEEVYSNIAPSDHTCVPCCNVIRILPYPSYGNFILKNEMENWEVPMSSVTQQAIRIRLHKLAT
uniref:Uncharacterized protein n=1 Tax=Plectus sambesii TaxID=2011161 RepID=A0A914UYL7_9BILA